MPAENHQIIVPSSRDIQTNRAGQGRIVEAMVSAILARSRMEAGASPLPTPEALVPRFKIGEHVFCEPDYQQILLWAKALRMEPESVLKELLKEPETRLADGRIVNLRLNLSGLSHKPIKWVDGLVIETLRVGGDGPDEQLLRAIFDELQRECTHLTELDLSGIPQLAKLTCSNTQLTELDLSGVPLLKYLSCSGNQLTDLDLSGVPLLTSLLCDENQITELDLSGVPQLAVLVCSRNQLTELDLSGVPLLTVLECAGNPLTELDIRSLHHLKGLKFDADETQLIQRPNQNF